MYETKKRLTLSDVKNMSWHEVFEYYFPDISDDRAYYLLWEKTCFPFDNRTTLSQIYDLYLEYLKEVK